MRCPVCLKEICLRWSQRLPHNTVAVRCDKCHTVFNIPEDEFALICPHCNYSRKIRNPSGYCDHLKWPENCDYCKTMERNKHE